MSQTNVSGNPQSENANGEKDDSVYYIEESKAGKLRKICTH